MQESPHALLAVQILQQFLLLSSLTGVPEQPDIKNIGKIKTMANRY